MEFKGTKQETFVFEDATGICLFTQRDLVCRTENRPNKEQAIANMTLFKVAPEMLNLLNEFIELGNECDWRPEDELNDLYVRAMDITNKALGYPDGKTD